MRQHLILLAALLLPRAALADGKPRPIDVKAVLDKLEVYRDDTGAVLVTPRPDSFEGDAADQWLFYGDTKTLYQQRIVGSSISGAKREWIIWSPRAKNMANADVTVDPTGVEVRCKGGKDGHQKLSPVPPDQARAILGKATFLPPLWDRSAEFLARDDDGVYFYVDALREELGGKGQRVFTGKKGGMKELSMTNIVSDSAGQIYATKTGELKIVAGTDGKAYWKRGGKKTELVVLPLFENRYLIYRELGIYGTLGVVCDSN